MIEKQKGDMMKHLTAACAAVVFALFGGVAVATEPVSSYSSSFSFATSQRTGSGSFSQELELRYCSQAYAIMDFRFDSWPTGIIIIVR